MPDPIILDCTLSLFLTLSNIACWSWAVSTGSSNSGLMRIVSQLERRKLVMKNPPHTAHISHSRLKECRLVLSGTRALPPSFKISLVVLGKLTLKGHKSISMFFSLIPIHLLTTRLATLKQSATVAREARVQAQEVGVINLVKFSQEDTS